YRGTDDSIAIVNHNITEHPRRKEVKIIQHNENKGTSCARNTALDAASAPYLYFMDSDDELTPDCLELLYNEILRCRAEVIAGGYKMIAGKDYRLYCPEKDLTAERDKYKAFFQYGTYNIPLWNKLYDRNFLQKNNIRCMEGQRQEDVVFSLQVIQSASYIRLFPRVTYLYYINENSAERERLTRFSERHFINQLDIIRYTLDAMTQKDNLYGDLFRTNILQRVMNVKTQILNSTVLLPEDKKRMFIELEEFAPVYQGPVCRPEVKIYRFIMRRPYRLQCIFIRIFNTALNSFLRLRTFRHRFFCIA
ncbi:MAG: glycosyltransferase, partial [Bacteroidales bacterium]|nr:glycosyltransferase [Bacteroidales bacterium]